MVLLSRSRVLLICAMSALVLAGCSSKKPAYVEKPIDELYNKAMDDLDATNYKSAAKEFDDVDQEHPNSSWATKAQLMSAYSLYKGGKQDEAVVALDRFIQLHPAYKDTPYAYYLKALCYYEQIADVQRDQKITLEAMSALQEVVNRYPDSRYARDARFKLDLVRDQLAGKDLAIGRFYEKRHYYLAAIERYKHALTYVDAQTKNQTKQEPEALFRLVECYVALGLHDEARRVLLLMSVNHLTGTDWYADAYALVEGGSPPVAQAAATTGANGQPADAGPPPKSGGGWFDWIPSPF